MRLLVWFAAGLLRWRVKGFEKHLIFYRAAEEGIDVVRILHGARDWAAVFESVRTPSDGAKWIWEEQRKHLTYAEGVLDIFHALEHVSAASQALHTEPTDAAEWTDAAREALLQDGWRGIQARLRVGEASLTPCQQAAVAELRNYLGARWRCRRVNRMAGLCSLMYSDQWQNYWEQAA